ncbi:predicted protein [Methanosarcina acetivorans C2A]|uniref:Uncharacterized protein n=1 Tax=Methanosarcina acetivorans (strain ATCC 35395 / DSM 2834 / JCM 12185 / C2A) TaxID=188937 RepID=Q8TSL0_METAC|nr:predicted protein [Methanosarcina acetivorans C2A]
MNSLKSSKYLGLPDKIFTNRVLDRVTLTSAFFLILALARTIIFFICFSEMLKLSPFSRILPEFSTLNWVHR